MTFPDDREEAVYTMLKHVLTNHCATYAMSPGAALSGCSLLVASLCAQPGSPAGDIPALVSSTVTALKQHLRARQDAPPLPPFGAVAASAPEEPVVQACAQALGQLLAEACEQQRITSEGAWQIALALTADVLAMLVHQFGNALDEVDALLNRHLAPALARQIAHDRTRLQGQG